MRTKSIESKEDRDFIEVAIPAVEILADAEREELEELRAERAKRIAAEAEQVKALEIAATSITLNLPPAAGRGIRHAGREYLHGHTYQVSNDVKWGLEEAERRCWSHEASLHESENKGRKQRRAFVGTGA